MQFARNERFELDIASADIDEINLDSSFARKPFFCAIK